MQSTLIDATTARVVYLKNKDKYPERKKLFVENEVYKAIENAIETKPHEFGVLLTSDIFQDFSTKIDIENQLIDLGYLVCNQFDSSYISWALSYYKPSRTTHRCFISAETQYKKCADLILKRHDEEVEQILSKINFLIKQELNCGTYGKKISLDFDKKMIQYIIPILQEKKYYLEIESIKNSPNIRLIISW